MIRAAESHVLIETAIPTSAMLRGNMFPDATGHSDTVPRRFSLWLKQYLGTVDCRDFVLRLPLRRKTIQHARLLIYRVGLSAVAWIQRVARKS